MRPIFVVAGAAGAALLGFTRQAEACGGCFHEPPQPMTQSVTVVTDHRMAFAVSKTATTLYDQIRYQGDPAKFAWVLPIAGTVEVGLSADVLFGSLDLLSQTEIVIPQLPPCPPPPSCPGDDYGFGDYGGGGCSCGAARGDSFAATDGGAGGAEDAAFAADAGAKPVEVTKQEVVGPYETVQLKASDPAALETWLANNGFELPSDVKPIVEAYQSEGFGFLALKLLPGQGVAAMRPIRVTTAGAGLALPLRMVSAGTGATVGVTLWVVAEGRYEPANFGTFRVADADLVWDWATRSSNYAKLRADETAKGLGAVFEVESSLDIPRAQLEALILSGGRGYGMAPAGADYLPITDPMDPKKVLETADQVRDDDLQHLLSGMNQIGRVTRLRADLAHAALAKDLELSATMDQSPLTNVRNVASDVNRPACPTYPPCPPPTPDYSRDRARGGSSCSAAADGASNVGLAVAAGVVALSFGRRRRRR